MLRVEAPLFHGAGTQQRLMRGCCAAGAVLQDVSQVWQNCRGFNAEGSDIHAMADEAEAHFVQLWARKDLPFEAADPPAASPGAGRHGSAHFLAGQPSSAQRIPRSTPLEGLGAHTRMQVMLVMMHRALRVVQGPTGCFREPRLHVQQAYCAALAIGAEQSKAHFRGMSRSRGLSEKEEAEGGAARNGRDGACA